MATLRRLCLLSLSVYPKHSLAGTTVGTPTVSLIQVRAKNKQAKRGKSKRDTQREVMKEFMKKQELDKLMQSASLKAAKMGEPFDPEMLNPARKRQQKELTSKETEEQFLLVKEWSRYCMQKHKTELKVLGDMVASREKALKELKKVSPSLYNRALELNNNLFPYECVGPNDTPPVEGYVPPDPEA